MNNLAQQKPHSVPAKYNEQLQAKWWHPFQLLQYGTANGLREGEQKEQD